MTRRYRQRGFALVSVMMLTLLVLLVAGMLLVPTLYGQSFTARSGTAQQSSNAAEAAVDFAMAALNAQIPTGASAALLPLPAYFTPVSGQSDTWAYADGMNGHFFKQTIGAAPVLTVRIPATVPVAGGGGVAGDYRIVDATVEQQGTQKRVQAIVRLQRDEVNAPYFPFTRAITARGNLTPNGNDGTLRTDSYNSALGPYGGTNMGYNGGVHVNGSILDGAVYAGNVTVSGTAHAGVSVTGPGNTLTVGAPEEDIPDAPPAPPTTRSVAVGTPMTIEPGDDEVIDLGVVSLSGNSNQVLVLKPGRYVASSISITGQASIRIEGDGLVELFVTGTVKAAGNGIANASQKPTNFVLNVTDPTAPVTLAGNGTFFGGVRAPANNVTLAGNGAFYGAVIGNNVIYNGSNSIVHYDEAMGLMGSGSQTVSRPSRFHPVALNVMDKT